MVIWKLGGNLENLIYGWVINDASGFVTKSRTIDGKKKNVWICPYYSDWMNMLTRCFCVNYQNIYPTYKGCSVSEEWRYFSDFIRWVDSQPNKDWQKCQLDKDFLFEGNREYAPTKCVYIPKSLNSFINSKPKSRGQSLLGTTLDKSRDKEIYQAICKNPFTGKRDYLGRFPNQLDAHLCWKAKKYEHALKLADEQPDERVAKRLREMYNLETDWTNK
ncbi:hypothetical protein Barba22A_gp021 [Rheinheimera phage vB_RspM_Barba22A]|jgi:hypothetical protein|uniref:tRNA nucleotidyltransferase n=74 Tax=Barbavirus TaxID=2733095 RepID=A0A7G9VS48_9CAUD|nr:HNH endonuclease [Rheinheimera phage Barba8S]YP_009822898.1 HNH endonuclease [Rheinheimera phage vB_RspM_Barba18A]QCQ57872.1 hypothetical protein Barba1A_gp021 [Rheinheimera phage vB_RspM_Barba1A]QCQ58008.1 hypothetical protein Barba1S_gp021 [Rheinheimera phage vB_RspM_Barba1S]QCQ58144.1 hypothetical protein Barba2A_gp021 [Rheinheimera phage vB_RspM_Barba2A]QCQ58280.1 hypothetical protein Barba2S_gp021 [Rheinheimera phage vB_RspM_Barba2S]QCQ58554.1 hypothetical protein Barba3S_gp021 [Rhein